MPRYRIILEYDGGGFAGWQRQQNAPSVQQALEEAIAKFTGETVTVIAAGRTDAGVHARAQVAHFDLAREFDANTVRNAINFHLKPAAVSILSAAKADPDFHSRFDAAARVYEYRIVNRRAPLALDRGFAWWIPPPLDDQAMAKAAQTLLGKHDFTTFRAAGCQAKSPLKTLDELAIRRQGDVISIHAKARSFLHRQVRNMAGALRLAGEGKWTMDDMQKALFARDRAAGGETAPAHGLYLVEVIY